MKKLFSMLVLLVLLLSLRILPAGAAEPERMDTDSLNWTFDAGSGLLSIRGSGNMRSYSTAYPPWEEYKDQITSIQLEEGITSVGGYAFYDYESLQSVYLPDSIEVIDTSAFDYCISLSTLTIPASLRYVGERAFYNTLIHDPADIVFPEGTEYIGEGAFHSALKTGGRIVLPSTVTYIGRCAFTNGFVSDITVSADNPAYKSVNHALMTKDGTELLMYASDAPDREFSVPEGVRKLHRECFNITFNLERLFIPASVTEIEEAAIFSTFNLREITVAEDNPAYRMIEGMLCTKDGKTLLAFPDGIEQTDITLPAGVERIAAYAFYGRHSVSSLTLPETVKSIGTLSLPAAITTLTLPKSLENIDTAVFYYPGCVADIFYGGTKADWQTLRIGEQNEGLESAGIHYSK